MSVVSREETSQSMNPEKEEPSAEGNKEQTKEKIAGTLSRRRKKTKKRQLVKTHRRIPKLLRWTKI